MKYNMSYTTNNGTNIGSKQSQRRISADSGRSDHGLTMLKKGQQVSGTVISVSDRVGLTINGQNLFTAKDIFKSVAVGDVKVFDVVSATTNMIELRLAGNNSDNSTANQQIITTTLSSDTDQEIFLARKEQSGQAAKQEKGIQETKKQLGDIMTKMNSSDYMLLENEGFAPEDFTVEGLNSALKRVKEKNSNNKNSQDEEDNKENNKINSDSNSDKNLLDCNVVEARLKAAGLTVSKDIVSNVITALQQSNTVANMNDKTMKYMISQNMDPTIENIYKAYYSQNSQKQDQSQSLSDSAWKELMPQVKEVIQNAGYEENEGNLKNAKWLLENNLPLTAQSLTYKNDLDKLKANSGEDQIFNQIVDGLKNGTVPQKVSLSNNDNTSYKQIVQDIQSISNETVENAVKNNIDLTIKNLKSLQSGERKINTEQTSERKTVEEKSQEIKSSKVVNEGQSNTSGVQNSTDIQNANTQTNERLSYDEIKAKRQLEEIRLKMTVEAASKLESKGFHIETEPLEKVVEELKKQEESSYKELLNEVGAETSDANVDTLKNTTFGMAQLRYIPSYVLGTTLSQQNTQTIPSLLSEGTSLSTKLMNAGEAYETLMTVPSKEYGDSIQKAFGNMSSLLSEMNLDNNQENQRAVRILGYNQMEINPDSIDKVKAYDLQVNSLIKNLNPAVTVRLIKDGINPLNMSITELNQTIDDVKEEQGITSEDRYSTYLNKLEKDNAITADERKGYIGIYRLLYQVDKTDGAALGSLIKSNQEVTLNHLLSAVHTLQKGSLNETVDDNFGTLQSITNSKETITEQLSAVFKSQNESQDMSGQSDNSENGGSQKAEYIKRMIKLMKDDISPQELKKLQKESVTQDSVTQGSQIVNTSSQTVQLTSEQGIWDTVKDIPIEKLYEELQNKGNENGIEQEVYEDKVKGLKESGKNTEQAIRFLNDFKIAATPSNLIQMSQILSNGDTPLKKLIKSQKDKDKENKEENSESGLKEITELSDKLTDKVSMQEAYEELDKEVKNTLSKSVSNEDINSMQLSVNKSIGSQLSLLKTLARKEFYQIPIETDNGFTNINLTILHNSEKSGKVSAVIQSDRLGNVKADFSLKDQTLKGYIRCDNSESLSILQNSMGNLEQVANEENITISQLNFGLQKKGTEVYDYLNKSEETDGNINSDTERRLYRIAKAMVLSVRAAELNDTNVKLIS